MSTLPKPSSRSKQTKLQKPAAAPDPQAKTEIPLQEHLALIVESSDDAIISKDLNGIIQSWNAGAERIFGYTAQEAIGKNISLLAASDRLDEIPNILEKICRGERVDHYKTRRRTKDGRILSVSLTVSPVRDANGNIVGASKIARDITEQERNQQALQATNEALARSNADLEQFAYSASHDLQEPLRMVSIYAELLQDRFAGTLGENGEQYVRFVVEGAARMQQLLRDLRAYIQTSTAIQDRIQEVDANRALEGAIASLSSAVEESGACITSVPLPSVRMHEFQMEQLFQNLLGNSIRYRGPDPPRIHIAAQRGSDHWRFSVQDNGLGIDPRYQQQIFGIFKRLHSATDYPGTGMGLAICQRIVERAGGKIWVESELGAGSIFFFTVPAEPRN